MRRALDLLALACRIGLGLMFLFAAATKIPDVAGFADEVANYRLLPAATVAGFAVATVGIELALALAFLLRFWTRAAALVTGLLLVVFTAALSQALLRGIDLRCGCFGGVDLASWATVARDVALLVPAGVVYFAVPPARRHIGSAARSN